MPVPVLRILARKAGVKIDTAEEIWNDVKDSLEKDKERELSYSKDFTELMSIVKKKLKLNEGILTFAEYLAVSRTEIL